MGPHPAVAAIRLAVRRVLHDVLQDVLATTRAAASRRVTAGAGARPGTRAERPGRRRAARRRRIGVRPPPRARRARRRTRPGRPAAGARRVQRRRRLHGARLRRWPSRRPGSACAPARSPSTTACRTVRPPAPPTSRPGCAISVSTRSRRSASPSAAQGGPEAAARDARYAALDAAAPRLGAAAVLLGHTRDDQAETVLLGLARGSGTRSLSGMAAVSGPGGRYRRPFLLLDRDTTRKACLAQGIDVWEDPHNADPAYTRSRVRHEALPVLEKSLGQGRGRLRWPAPPQLSATTPTRWTSGPPTPEAAVDGRRRRRLDVRGCAALPAAVRRRVLRRRPSRRAVRPARCSPGTSRRSTGWSPAGAARAPLNLPGRRRGAQGGWQTGLPATRPQPND